MPIPDYQTCMLPLLRLTEDGREYSLREAIDRLAEEFALTDAERHQLLTSGRQAILTNRVSWARTYLSKARLLESTRRGFFCITARGRQVLAQSPPREANRFLRQFERRYQLRPEIASP